MLEQFRHAKEEGRRFLRAERLADVEEVHDLCQEDAAFPRADRRLVEHSGFLDHSLRAGQGGTRVSLIRGAGRVEHDPLTVLSWKKDPTPPWLSSSFL